MDNYKYDGLIARAKITEMISKTQCEVAKQQKNCYKDKENMIENGIPANHLDVEYKNLQELYDELNKILDNFR
jgi:actin-like ATPase involved in cell morphogenesis